MEKKEQEKEGGEEEGEEHLRTDMDRTQKHTHDLQLPHARTQTSPRHLLHPTPPSTEQKVTEPTENQPFFSDYFMKCSRLRFAFSESKHKTCFLVTNWPAAKIKSQLLKN